MISNIVPMIHLPPFTPIVPSHLTLAKISYDPLVAARQLLTLLADDGSADIPMPLFDPPALRDVFSLCRIHAQCLRPRHEPYYTRTS